MRFHINRYFPLVLTICLSLLTTLPAVAELPLISQSLADQPVVHVVLFYSPTCGHCQKVMAEDLPPLIARYGNQLTIIEINATEEEGKSIFLSALQQFNVPSERVGVPALFVGNTHLVGSVEIPEQFPGIIESGLEQGGIALPVIPGLDNYLEIYQPKELEPQGLPFVDKFMQDPVGNSIAVIVLIGMLVSVIAVGISFLRATEDLSPSTLPDWVVPALCIIGLGIAGYLSYIEITSARPICGPVGDCETVQTSSYAKLFGVLHVGVLGVIGYLAILGSWLVKRFGGPSLTRFATLAMWGLSLFGILFAIYLTFLEPFVIGATCAWCIGNSIVITLLVLATTKPALIAAGGLSDGDN